MLWFRYVPLVLMIVIVVWEMWLLARCKWWLCSDWVVILTDILVLATGIGLYMWILFGNATDYYLVRTGIVSTGLATLLVLNHWKNVWARK